MNTIELVKEFHDAFGVENKTSPDLSNVSVNELRLDLLTEELDELIIAIDNNDAVSVLDALTDIQYVLDGTYLALGFASLKKAAFKEVHRSNMSKLGEDGKPMLSESGKVLKGSNYSKPNLKAIIEKSIENLKAGD
jgi:predicted HAD superfamily Cof-like phosphohydrolase